MPLGLRQTAKRKGVPLVQPRKIELIEKRETRTSRGILSKGWYNIDGKLVLAKGNSITENGTAGLEPYSEAMASQIAGVLGIPHIEYTLLPAALFPDITTHGCAVVSVCENFLQPGETLYHFGDMLDAAFAGSGQPKTAEARLAYAKELYGEKWLYQMLVLDAFIGNEDRHENNFDIIRTGAGEWRNPPLYDCGASLLAWAAEDELNGERLRYGFDRAKPFRSRHAQQMKLVEVPVLPKRDEKKLYAEILRAIAPTLALLSEKRAAAIGVYLQSRMRYLTAAMEEG